MPGSRCWRLGWLCSLIAMAACAPPRAPAPLGPPSLFEVRSKPLMVSSWSARVAPGTRYSIVDEGGYITDVIADGADPSECDHCPPHRALAHLVGEVRATEGSVVALGPVDAPLTSAKVLSHRDVSSWWNPAHPTRDWWEDLAIDLDGDGKPDLIREASGPQLSHRVRRHENGGWHVIAEWTEPYVLDVDE